MERTRFYLCPWQRSAGAFINITGGGEERECVRGRELEKKKKIVRYISGQIY